MSGEDAPFPTNTLSDARFASVRYAELCNTPLSTNDPGIMWATLAVAAELRALALLLEDMREQRP